MIRRLRRVPANGIEAVHVAGGEVRERYARVLDVLRCAQEATGLALEREGADYASFVVGRERDCVARVVGQHAALSAAVLPPLERRCIELVVNGCEPLQAPLLEVEDKVVAGDFLRGAELRAASATEMTVAITPAMAATVAMTTSRRMCYSLPYVATLRCDRSVRYMSRKSVTPLAQGWLKASLVGTTFVTGGPCSRPLPPRDRAPSAVDG